MDAPRPARVIAGLITTVTLEAGAMNWHQPQPWRADAVVQGRDQDYNSERFLHVFSYRHLSSMGPLEDGIRGTAGSVTGDRLYLDFQYRQTFPFDNPDRAFLLDIQRGEDFDGDFQRQVVGFRQILGGRWQLSLRGDLFSDKSRTDIYFGVRRLLAGGGWLEAQWVLPDAYFNDKTGGDSEMRRRPHTLFLQWHRPHGDGAVTTVSLNHSPRSVLDDRDEGVEVASRQTRLALSHGRRWGGWGWRLDLEAERTRRDHDLDEVPGGIPFERDMAAVTLSATQLRHRWQPELGVRYLRLDESGWFGREVNDAGRVKRREPLLFSSLNIPLNERHRLLPALYVSRAGVEQDAIGDWSERDDDDWIGKLSVPWQIVLSREQDAVLTIAPSVRLHRAAFGGGNIQLHWPL
ncbi:hypothetical protein [Alloalcanivorax xenomutans]|uniref:Uncharacterized protein n=1 Tax=Alloalcanivorax xenomutans TaxID=1094342 RepID=A0A9Q3ZF07_9GAMM|nr:hypothetical protein [Alloalcanivorax xenomutans]ARB46215.1 hypothetical protein P40_13075 [Alloalcanivorax xenomutans]MCE7511363.1 hypothetical protein [Alloalcanivorax xenomutans]